ncbi:MAG TPA: hypothetical protein VJR94_10265 [Candidatus Nitrosocosmicus sp.]|nr:hypothetical protein [Candidatus Nitrosocosmicus sp.]
MSLVIKKRGNRRKTSIIDSRGVLIISFILIFIRRLNEYPGYVFLQKKKTVDYQSTVQMPGFYFLVVDIMTKTVHNLDVKVPIYLEVID